MMNNKAKSFCECSELATLKKVISKIGDYTEANDRDTVFCNWWGNPLPYLPTIEETWAGEYVLMCTESQYEAYQALDDEEFIVETDEIYFYEDGFGLKKKDVECVLVYA